VPAQNRPPAGAVAQAAAAAEPPAEADSPVEAATETNPVDRKSERAVQVAVRAVDRGLFGEKIDMCLI
jgi:hypothetical protein